MSAPKESAVSEIDEVVVVLGTPGVFPRFAPAPSVKTPSVFKVAEEMLAIAELMVRAVEPPLLSAVAERDPVKSPSVSVAPLYVPLNKRVPPAPVAVMDTAPAEVTLPIVKLPVPSTSVIPFADPSLLNATVPTKLFAALAKVIAAAPASMVDAPETVKTPACVIAPPFEVASNVPPIVAAPEKLSAPVEVAVKFCPIVNVPKVNAPLLVI